MSNGITFTLIFRRTTNHSLKDTATSVQCFFSEVLQKLLQRMLI